MYRSPFMLQPLPTVARTSLGTHPALPREGGGGSHPEPHVAPKEGGLGLPPKKGNSATKRGEWCGYVVVCALAGGGGCSRKGQARDRVAGGRPPRRAHTE